MCVLLFVRVNEIVSHFGKGMSLNLLQNDLQMSKFSYSYSLHVSQWIPSDFTSPVITNPRVFFHCFQTSALTISKHLLEQEEVTGASVGYSLLIRPIRSSDTSIFGGKLKWGTMKGFLFACFYFAYFLLIYLLESQTNNMCLKSCTFLFYFILVYFNFFYMASGWIFEWIWLVGIWKDLSLLF